MNKLECNEEIMNKFPKGLIQTILCKGYETYTLRDLAVLREYDSKINQYNAETLAHIVKSLTSAFNPEVK